ncbi:MAG: hypothetical protein QOK81_05895 [Nitrososphaeraceae archaeon]|nr:hypothetical protein [Nitrososphaeraceae archaeon]
MISSSTTLTQQNKCGTAGGHSYVGKLKLASDRKAFKLQQQQHGNERDLEENRDPMDASCKVSAT